MKTAIIIANMGGPESLDSVEPYLTNIFMDPAIISIPLPHSWRKKLAAFIAHKRIGESKEIYSKIGGKTPLIDITNQQALGLENLLNEDSKGSFAVFPAMRYWRPFIEDVWAKIINGGFEQIVVLSLYPFYSFTTSRSLFDLVDDLHKASSGPAPIYIDRFGAHPFFIKAIASQINLAIEQNPGFKDVLLSAHSIPMRSIKKGDPYFKEIEQTVAGIRELVNKEAQLHLAFQSKVGPVKWLGPATPDKIEELAHDGVKNLLAYPLGFVADNSETIYEIGMLYKELAQEKGITNFIRIDSLNDHPLFIECLKNLVFEHLNTNKNKK